MFKRFINRSRSVSAPGVTPLAPKVTISRVLNDELLSPYGLADFFAFLQKERSHENLEFFSDVARYVAQALPIYEGGSRRTLPTIGSILKSSTLSDTESRSSENSDSTLQLSIPPAQLQMLARRVESIISTYLTPQADMEINLPQTIRKRLLFEVREKNNYHPEIFEDAVDHITTMMRLSSFPNFLRSAFSKDNRPAQLNPGRHPSDLLSGSAISSPVVDCKFSAKIKVNGPKVEAVESWAKC
ncbi:hypothetical protein HKX48_003845 [Thoreauomyces humboldtii]|nr:hypothetical protein HKX48_003845 [Thoreauomyces humboldtii]